MLLSGAELVLKCLKDYEVDSIFGFPGGAVIPIYDALYRDNLGIKHYRTCHEQGAVHAADGYARATGKVGVCLVTSGPGATNTVTGIATAFMDSSPLLILTGQVSSGLIGRDSFQEVDITAMTLTITKHCEMVKSIDQLQDTLYRAMEIAIEGRPGPVLIDIPKDIMTQKIEYRDALVFDGIQSNIETHTIPKGLKEALQTAKRPVIIAGGGVNISRSNEALLKWASETHIPVANTLMGSGAFPQTHPLSLGLIGMHGNAQANRYLGSADLIIALGVRFSDRVVGSPEAFCKGAEIIHVDIDSSEFGKNKNVDYPWRVSIQEALNAMFQLTRGCVWDGEKDLSKLDLNRAIYNGASLFEQDQGFNIPLLFGQLKDYAGSDTTVVTEVGQHQMWTAQYYGFENVKTFITSGGLGTMGFGLGAAIGVSVAQSRRVLHIAGDGSFKMNCNELETVSKYHLPITTVIMNNHSLGMVRQWQGLFCEGRYSETDANQSVDIVKLAEAYGIKGYRVSTHAQLKAVLDLIKKIDGPALIECEIHPDEGVYPIIPAGKGIEEMLEASAQVPTSQISTYKEIQRSDKIDCELEGQIAKLINEIPKASAVLKGVIKETPLLYSAFFSEECGNQVYIKPENLQRTGAFKIRGAYFKLSQLTDVEKRLGVVTASAGNHAQGVALAASEMGISATIVMPSTTPLIKVNATKAYGAEVVLSGDNFDEAYQYARQLTGRVFIHPFEDFEVMAGQGTIGAEIMSELPSADIVLVPVGGGGLIGGIAAYVKTHFPNCKVIGVEPEGAASMKLALNKACICKLDAVHTIADGVAVKMVGDANYQLAKRYIDEIVTVSDYDIMDAFLMLLEKHKIIAENAGVLSLASLKKLKVTDKKVVCVVSGGNIDVVTVSAMINKGLTRRGRIFCFSVDLPDTPGQLLNIAQLLSDYKANVIKLDHNQFMNFDRFSHVQLQVTVETNGHDHIRDIVTGLNTIGYIVKQVY